MKIIAILVFASVLTACTATNVQHTTNNFSLQQTAISVLLMDPDVQLGQLIASGGVDPRADWTTSAYNNITSEIKNILAAKQQKFLNFNTQIETAAQTLQLIRLHEAVAQTIHTYGPGSGPTALPLPTKKDIFDWSLGPDVRQLGQAYSVDYALFVTANGSYASGGRVVTSVFMAALGISLPLGQQIAYASLIDLRTGDIVWFNVALTGESSDLRKEDGARALMQSLLKEIPL